MDAVVAMDGSANRPNPLLLKPTEAFGTQRAVACFGDFGGLLAF
jgi:hypothetical protein